MVNGPLELKLDEVNSDYFASPQWPLFMASLNAYFAHRELEIPPSKRRSYKNLQDAANIQWHRYTKNQKHLLQLEIKYWKGQTTGRAIKGHAFVYILSRIRSLPVFLLTLSCVLIWSRNMVNPTELSLRLLENKLSKEFLTKRQDKQRIRKPADFTRSPRWRRESGKEQFRFSDENEHSSVCQ